MKKLLTTLCLALIATTSVFGKQSKPTSTTSFEGFKPGIFVNLKTPVGTWIPDEGRTIVDHKHAKTGSQCLQITGGAKSSVILEFTDEAVTSGVLSFWAERWTARSPFSFRIEKSHGENWEEIYNGDAQVKVGRSFLNHVKIPLGDHRIRKLRFTVTSPTNTGVLIDDLRIAPAKPQKILGVEMLSMTLPALVGLESSPLAKLKIETTGALKPISLVGLEGKVVGKDLASVQIAGVDSQPKADGTFQIQVPEGKLKMEEGENFVTVEGTLVDDPNIDRQVGVAISEVVLSNGQTYRLDDKPTFQRLGVALRNGGDDGVHTFRIPGLVTTNKGTLVGVYDIRRGGGGDLPGNIDVGMSRSIDGGRTWEPMQVIMDMGDDPKWHYDGIGDPAILVDRSTGTIWVASTWSHGNRSWRGSGPGLEPEETGQLMLVKSDDDGVTWSKPINITKQVKRPEWCFLLQGPGKGITMQDGTIVFAAQYQDPPEKKRLPHSTILYSKDHGKSWHIGTGAFDDTTEAQVVEVEPGVLMLNCRYNRKAVRVVMTTRNMGKTWQKHPTSERSLIEPGACMASLIDTGDWLLFSNPDSTRGRHHITIKASPDRGLTWPKENRLLLDEGRGRGYSCMTMIDGKTVGILYEGSQAHMTFQRVPLCELIGGKLPVPPPVEEARLRLPQVFGDHMVLQSGAATPVWGHAKPGAKVSVKLGKEQRVTTTDEEGRWMVRMKPQPVSKKPVRMSINSEGERIEFEDVLVGEVWLCAGQSNMAWTLSQSTGGKEELLNADHPNLRLLHLSGGASGSSGSYTEEDLLCLTPDSYSKGSWKVASAESARDFSAVSWYFGRKLQKELDVPIGLICPAVGGTPAEAWIPREALGNDPDLKALVTGNWLDNQLLGEFCRTRGEQNLIRSMQAGDAIPGDELGPNHSFKPGFMWSAGVEPLIPYAIRGTIWYQGESNAETSLRVRQHERLFPLLIHQWRERWGQGDFPFLYVQLPALNRPAWPEFRDSQRRILDRVANTGMAITIDTGHASNVHPSDKKPVGERLATWAVGTIYSSKSDTVYSGPLIKSTEQRDHSIVLKFEHVGEGLAASDQQPLRHFEIRSKTGQFKPATARIVGKDAIEVASKGVEEPKHVRYAWKPYPTPKVNLVNSLGLPASPFATETHEERMALRKTQAARPNILFIVSEDNSDHLGCYGEKRVHTPHLDKLAAGGVRYTRAYVPYSVCSPSRAVFLTGLYTRQTGHIGLATHRFSMYKDFKTMPAYFREAGYYTGFLGKTHVNPASLVEDHIDHRAISNSNFSKTISIKNYAEEADKVLSQAAEQEKPFLLIINYADAHRKFVGKSKNGYPTVLIDEEIKPYPWIGSDSPHLREELRNYLNCMNRLDEGIGMVLGELEKAGVRDNTLVVYISDHGADFPRAKGSIYENGTRIPMIVNDPKRFQKGKVEKGMVSTIDILPTLMKAARLPIPKHLPGIALQDIDSGKIPPRKYIHTFTTGSSPNLLYLQFGIRDEQYKLVYNPDRALNRLALSRYKNSKLPQNQQVQSFLNPPEYELFDLQKDPHEWNNLADSVDHAPIREQLMKEMRRFQTNIKDPFANHDNIGTFLAEQKEYQHKPYKKAGFRWPHLEMFENAQKGSEITYPVSAQ